MKTPAEAEAFISLPCENCYLVILKDFWNLAIEGES